MCVSSPKNTCEGRFPRIKAFNTRSVHTHTAWMPPLKMPHPHHHHPEYTSRKDVWLARCGLLHSLGYPEEKRAGLARALHRRQNTWKWQRPSKGRERERERGKEQRERSVFTLGKSTSKKWREFARKKGGTKVEKCYEISSNLANLIRNLIPNLICCPSSPSQSSFHPNFWTSLHRRRRRRRRKKRHQQWVVGQWRMNEWEASCFCWIQL